MIDSTLASVTTKLAHSSGSHYHRQRIGSNGAKPVRPAKACWWLLGPALTGVLLLCGVLGCTGASDSIPSVPRCHSEPQLVPVRDNETGLYGYKYSGTTAEYAIAPRFRSARDFSQGLAVVGIPAERPNLTVFRYIDSEGTFVFPYRFALAGSFRNGIAYVVPLGEDVGGTKGRGGVINRNGEFPIGLHFNYGSENWPYARPVFVNGQWGYKWDDEWLLEPQFDRIRRSDFDAATKILERRLNEEQWTPPRTQPDEFGVRGAKGRDWGQS